MSVERIGHQVPEVSSHLYHVVLRMLLCRIKAISASQKYCYLEMNVYTWHSVSLSFAPTLENKVCLL